MIGIRELDAFEEHFGSPGRALAWLIRPAIAAPKGRTLCWADWSAIEARALPWLANSQSSNAVVDNFHASDADRTIPDVYCAAGGDVTHRSATEVYLAYKAKEPWGVHARQMGKVCVLSLGFGGGVGALQNMAVGYRISLSDIEAKEAVDLWRAGNPWARAFWDDLWAAFLRAHKNPGEIVSVGRVAYMFDEGYRGGTMLCFLPDGRPLVYPELRWERRSIEDREGNVEVKLQLTYARGLERKALWYGVLAENITQATAGSLLRNALRLLQPAPGLEYGPKVDSPLLRLPALICGHTHDEIIAETNDNEEAIEMCSADLRNVMRRPPEWAEGLPLEVEVTNNWYYTKALD